MKTNNNCTIPVLMYHHVNPDGNFINVKPEVFETHIRFLKDHGYTSIHAGDMISIMKGQNLNWNKPIMITFDDGWLDNWCYAYPILKKYEMKAVIFIITSLIADEGRRQRYDEADIKSLPTHRECQMMIKKSKEKDVVLSWDEIEEMASSGLVEFHSHTHSHVRWDKHYSDTQKLNEALYQDLATAKSIITDKLNLNVHVLCWPWGQYTDDYVKIAKSLGYQLQFTTETGTNTSETDPMRIKRIVIGNIGLAALRKKLFIHSRPWLSKMYLRYFK